MTKIAIFYHCRLSGGDPPIQLDHAIDVMSEQMAALIRSGLYPASTEMHVGVNGGAQDALVAGSILHAAGMDSANLMQHPDEFRGEHPTLFFMKQWAETHPDWMVFYHHIKGACHAGNETWAAWRRCMENALVWRWQRCIMDLSDNSIEAAGTHWMTPERHPGIVAVPNFAGNFWWARSSLIKRLPPIAQTAVERLNFYDAEAWIGRANPRPLVVNYEWHWPGQNCIK